MNDLRKTRSFHSSYAGVLIETIILLPTFLLALLYGIDLLIYSYRAASLEIATNSAARFLQINLNAHFNETLIRKQKFIRNNSSSYANKYGLPISPAEQIGYCKTLPWAQQFPRTCALGTIAPADPMDLFCLTMAYTYRSKLLMRDRTITASACGRNEPTQ